MFTPFNGKLLVKKIKKENKTSGGILLGEIVQDVYEEARVIAVADFVIVNGQVIKLHDKIFENEMILIIKNAGVEYKHDGEVYHIIELAHVIGTK